jgi:hypothetical protein
MSSVKQTIRLAAGLGIDLDRTSSTGVTVGIDENVYSTAVSAWNGSILEEDSIAVTSDGVVSTFSVERLGGGDLTVVFSDGFFTFDTTPPATIDLVSGSDSSPQLNLVSLLKSTKQLVVSTTNFPLTEHAPLAAIICQSAASVQNDGAYKIQTWLDPVSQANNQGHIANINLWIRLQNARWFRNVDPTLTITDPGGGNPDTVIFNCSSGDILLLQPKVFPAFTGTPNIYTVNDSVTPFNIVTDLNQLLTDASGNSMVNRFFSLVIWGVFNEGTVESKLMINLPSDTYGTASGVSADDNKFANFTFPRNFLGSAFLIVQYNLHHSPGGGGTWTLIDEVDLRGFFPGTVAGAGSALGSEFVDNAFRIVDEADNTKEMAFSVNQVSTSTLRTISMADRDIDLDDVGLAWSEETSTSASLAIGNGTIADNVAQVTLTLPVTIAVGQRVGAAGKGAGGYQIAQNAGQIIHVAGSATTTGVGGSLTSTSQFDCLELLCITANTTFVVRNSEGTFTIV